jgi:hypothetical protein
MVVSIPDARLHALLGQVWVPWWQGIPEEDWDDPDMRRYPGMEAARATRHGRREP